MRLRYFLGFDPFEQYRGGFVIGILRDQLTGEGLLQDRLAEGGGLLEFPIDLGFSCINKRKCLLKNA